MIFSYMVELCICIRTRTHIQTHVTTMKPWSQTIILGGIISVVVHNHISNHLPVHSYDLSYIQSQSKPLCKPRSTLQEWVSFYPCSWGDRGKPPFKFQQPVIFIYLAVRDDIIWGLVGETVKETNYLRVSNTILFELTTEKQKRS